jgi:adenosylcobinamide amidohydrolase
VASTSDAVKVSRVDAWLVARFAQPQRVLSWAIVGGGFTQTDAVAWLEVKNADLPAGVDPRALLRSRMVERGLAGAVGLLTSRRLDAFVDVTRVLDGVAARCVATVGLGNALRAGDLPTAIRPVGTINVLCHVSVPLTDEGMLEALALASEAKALAVRESGVQSIATRAGASGTGTDCLVIASPPIPAEQTAHCYAGKHTSVGAAIGAAVHDAVAAGAVAWKQEQGWSK